MRSMLFVGVLASVSVVLTTAQESFKLEDFLRGTYSDDKYNGMWYSDAEILYPTNNGDYNLFNIKTLKNATFLAKKQLGLYKSPSLTVSPNQKYVLVKYEARAVYRHSTLAKFAVLKADDKTPLDLASIKDEFLQTCRFNKDGTSLIYVQGNNIRTLSLEDTSEGVTHVTYNGNEGVLYNGVPDWVYEEEVIGGDTALWVSPYSNKFVFARFADDNVRTLQYPTYGEPGNYKDLYPTWNTIHYPKVGTNNPKFSVHIYDPAVKKHEEFKLFPISVDSSRYVLYDVIWRSDEKVVISYTNRAQTEGTLAECDVKSRECTELQSQSVENGWLDIQPLEVIDDAGTKKVVEVFADPRKDFNALRVITDKYTTNTIDLADKTITKIIGNVGTIVYFEATPATNHSQQHVYSVDINNERSVKCINCESCAHQSAKLSPGSSYMIRICNGPEPSYVDIVDLNDNTIKPYVWLDNADLRNLLEKKKMPVIRDMTFEVEGSGTTAAVRLLLPPGLSEADATKYPMMVEVYAGPNSNKISDAYAIGLQHYLVTDKNYIYAYIDGSGSGKRGKKIMHKVYANLGKFEIDDQIAVTRMLRDKFAFIDPARIGIWGWSYGGFSTAHVIARDKDTFKCGVSVAPVTNFIYYDSIYTERYMGLYPENKEKYEATDVTKLAENFRNKSYLLVHGNGDDNVHYQQAMLFARALEKADVPFRQMSYPDEAHALSGVKPHLYHMLDAFWSEHFAPDSLPSSSPTQQQLNMVAMMVSLVVVAFFH